ncbi:MAG: ThuA domain-containing protein [Chloroflexota bacterium]|nr:ThuA domain-containing protein [Chloroflexota bacterium]
MVRVTIWNEYRHEKVPGTPAKIYPDGMHAPIAEHLRGQGHEVRIATLDDPDHGLPDDLLNSTDVLTWWGHLAHGEVSDALVDKIQQRVVMGGMGLVVLHSGHFSKIFKRLMGTTCDLKWREIGEKERVWVIEPGHPVAAGLPEYFEIPHSEMYGERFDIPQPDTLVFTSWFAGGEIFRSGCAYQRGRGKIFYFSPGHETYPIYYQAEVLQVIANAVHWVAPDANAPAPRYGNHQPLEAL